MPTFDIVSKVEIQEIDNAINNTRKELQGRYDFRGSKTTIELNKKDGLITLHTEDEMKVRALREMLSNHLAKRKIDPRALEFGAVQPALGSTVKVEVKIQQGVSTEVAREIVKMIKDSKLKVQAAIQDEQVRVSGKQIDDLQAIIKMLHASAIKIPLQFVNMKS
jgi:uncharacterized protein YajQ (UPF0234 family)